MDKPKLTYRFYDGNEPLVLAQLLLRVCIDANAAKIEQRIRDEAAITLDENSGVDMEQTKNAAAAQSKKRRER